MTGGWQSVGQSSTVGKEAADRRGETALQPSGLDASTCQSVPAG